MSKKKVSVIVPVYNAEKYLNECLYCIVNQTEIDIEVLLINDGSTDNSLEILRSFEEKDNRVKVIDIKNHGVSYVRNIGIQMSNADWVMFVDADDCLPLNSIELLYSAVSSEIDIICGDYCDFTEFSEIKNSSERVGQSYSFSNKILLDCCCIVNPHSHKKIYGQRQSEVIFPALTFVWGKLYRRKAILSNHIVFNESLARGEDQEFNIRFINVCEKVSSIGSVTYYYRNHPFSASRSWKNACSEYIQYSSALGHEIGKVHDTKLYQFWNLKRFEIIMKMVALVANSKESKLKDRIIELKKFINSNQYNEVLDTKIEYLSRSQTLIQKLLRMNMLYLTVYLFKIRFSMKEMK